MTILLGRFAGGNSILLNRFGTRLGTVIPEQPYEVRGFDTVDFLSSLLNLINVWGDNYGVKPRISKVYDRKVMNYGTVRGDNILLYVDDEKITPFGLGIAFGSNKWMHDLSATVEVISNISDDRCQQIVSAVTSIIQNNISFDGYFMVIVRKVTNRNDDSRNIYRNIIDISAKKYAPKILV